MRMALYVWGRLDNADIHWMISVGARRSLAHWHAADWAALRW